eukprot:gene3490-3949_t
MPSYRLWLGRVLGHRASESQWFHVDRRDGPRHVADKVAASPGSKRRRKAVSVTPHCGREAATSWAELWLLKMQVVCEWMRRMQGQAAPIGVRHCSRLAQARPGEEPAEHADVDPAKVDPQALLFSGVGDLRAVRLPGCAPGWCCPPSTPGSCGVRSMDSVGNHSL